MFRELELKRCGLAGALLLGGQLFGCGQSAAEDHVGVETGALVLPIQVSSIAVLAKGRATFGDRTAVELAPGAPTAFNDGGGYNSSNYSADYRVVVSNTAELTL